MKKFMALLLGGMLTFSLVACGGSEAAADDEVVEEIPAQVDMDEPIDEEVPLQVDMDDPIIQEENVLREEENTEE